MIRGLGLSMLILSGWLCCQSPASDLFVPVSFRAVSVSSDDFGKVFPGGMDTRTLDSNLVKRLERAIQLGRAKESVGWRKSVRPENKEIIDDTSIVRDEGLSYKIGLFGHLLLSGTGASRSCDLELSMTAAGTLEGSSATAVGGKFARRTKRVSGVFELQDGATTLLGVLPPCPTDGDRNLTLCVLSLGALPGAAMADSARSPSRGITAEIFALPTTTVGTPKPVVLERMRAESGTRASVIKLQCVAPGRLCRASSTTDITYFTQPGRTEMRSVGTTLESLPDHDGEFLLEYTYVAVPYTSKDYQRAADYIPKKGQKPGDFAKIATLGAVTGVARIRPKMTSPAVVRLESGAVNPAWPAQPVHCALVTQSVVQTDSPAE